MAHYMVIWGPTERRFFPTAKAAREYAAGVSAWGEATIFRRMKTGEWKRHASARYGKIS